MSELACHCSKAESCRGARGRHQAVLLIILTPVIFLIPLYLNGGLGPLEDDLIQYFPSLAWLGRCLRAGAVPLWNSLAYGGYPAWSDPQAGVFYPVNVVFAMLPAPVAYSLVVTLHYWLAGWGMYRLGRSWRAARSSAVFGAVAFMFCGFLVGHRTHLTILAGGAWMAVIMWLWTKVVDGDFHRCFWLVILAQGLQILSGHIQIAILTAMMTLPYVLIYSDRRRARCAWLWVISLLIALGLASIQLLGGVGLFATSVRAANSYAFFTENSFFPLAWPIVVAPALMGLRIPNAVYQHSYFGPWHHCEMNCFTGLVVLALAIGGLWTIGRQRRRKRLAVFLGIAAAISVFLALGRYNPLYRVLFHVPIYRSLRCPARTLLWFNFAIACLATLGLDGLRQVGRSIDARRLARIVILLMLAVVAYAGVCRLVLEIHDFTPLLPGHLKFIPSAARQALTASNPAILIPCVIALSLALIVRRIAMRRLPTALIILALVEFATIVPLYDVYIPPRSASTTKPVVAEALDRLDSDKTGQLIWPVGENPYRRPLDYLHPFCNLLFGRATVTGYGPFLQVNQRRLFGFELWPTSSRWVDVISRRNLLARMGVTYVIAEPDAARQVDALTAADAPTEPPVSKSLLQDDGFGLGPGQTRSFDLNLKGGLYRLAIQAWRGSKDDLCFFLRVRGIDDRDWSQQQLQLRRWDLDEYARTVYWSFYVPPQTSGPVTLSMELVRGMMHVDSVQIEQIDLPLDWLAPRWRSLDGAVIYRNNNSRGRAYFSPVVRWVESTDEAIERILADDAKRTYLLKSSTTRTTTNIGTGDVIAATWGINTIELDVQVESAPAVLVVADSYRPGWYATIDGQPTEVLCADGMLKSVFVDPGRHRVKLTYLPKAFILAATVSGVSALMVLLFAFYRRLWPNETAFRDFTSPAASARP